MTNVTPHNAQSVHGSRESVGFKLNEDVAV